MPHKHPLLSLVSVIVIDLLFTAVAYGSLDKDDPHRAVVLGVIRFAAMGAFVIAFAKWIEEESPQGMYLTILFLSAYPMLATVL